MNLAKKACHSVALFLINLKVLLDSFQENVLSKHGAKTLHQKTVNIWTT